MEKHLIQGSKEWLDWRKDRIGASDAPIIMGVSPFKTALQLYNEKKGLVPEPEMNQYMQRGHDLEPIAREWYKNETGTVTIPHVIVHPDYTWMHASLDGLDFTGEVGVEIKCPGTNKLKDIDRYGIPAEYICQIQHQIFCAELRRVDLVIFDGIRGRIYTIERDQEYIVNLLEKELEFYECLINNTPPEPTKLSKSKVQYESIEKAKSKDWKRLKNELAKVKERIASDTAKKAEIEQAIKEIANGRNIKGEGLEISYTKCRGPVDYANIPELMGVDLDRFRKPDIEKVTIKVKE